MRSDTDLTCPHCREVFKKQDAVWCVCTSCGHVRPPGGSEHCPGPGPAAGENGRLHAAFRGECCTGNYVYTETDAARKQRHVRAEKREEYEEAGAVPRWEQPGYEEGWTPGDEW